MTSPRPSSVPFRGGPVASPPDVPRQAPELLPPAASGTTAGRPADLFDATGARLIVVADHDLRDDETVARLREAGHAVTTAASGEQALQLLARESFDLVVTDIVLAGMSGHELCRALREESELPVIVLTAVEGLSERLLAFDSGADDFVARPVAPSELDRRIRAVLRRQRAGGGSSERGELQGPDGLWMDVRAHIVQANGAPVQLTPKEFAVLRLLLERRGEVLSSDTISLEIWGHETFGSRNFVEAHVSRLRRKLLAAGGTDAVETVRGVGYVIRSGGAARPR